MSGTGLEVVLVNIAMAALSSFDHRHPFASKKFRVETMTAETERVYQQQHSVDEDDDDHEEPTTSSEQEHLPSSYSLHSYRSGSSGSSSDEEEDCIFTRRQRRRRCHRTRSRGSEHYDEA